MNYAQIVDVCCRDLQRYLECALATTRGDVITVNTDRVMQVAPPSPLGRRHYAMCLGDVLRKWRWNRGVYVVPQRDAETLLRRFDEICASIRNRRHTETVRRRVDTPTYTSPATDGNMERISFRVPPALAKALDEYARRKNTTWSAVVREALQLLIEKYRDVEVDIQHTATLAVPAMSEDESVLVTFHEIPYVIELLDMYAAALQVSRSDVVRAAIQHMLDRFRAVATP